MEDELDAFCAVTGATSAARVAELRRGLGPDAGLDLLVSSFFELPEGEQATFFEDPESGEFSLPPALPLPPDQLEVAWWKDPIDAGRPEVLEQLLSKKEKHELSRSGGPMCEEDGWDQGWTALGYALEKGNAEVRRRRRGGRYVYVLTLCVDRLCRCCWTTKPACMRRSRGFAMASMADGKCSCWPLLWLIDPLLHVSQALPNTRMHTHTRMHTQTRMHTHTHIHMHTHTHAHTHMHARTHTTHTPHTPTGLLWALLWRPADVN
jgi:hypothetical protein